MRIAVRAGFVTLAAVLMMLPACGGDGTTAPPTAGAAAKVSGDLQVGNRGSTLPVPIKVRGTDSSGTPVKGVTVHFAVTSGGGSIAPATMVTNDSGYAFASWTLGTTTTTQTATATVGALAPLVFTASGVPASAPGFQITVVNIGPPLSPAVQAAFDAAVSFWQSAITGDILDYPSHTIDANSCGNSTAIGPINVDDIVILAEFDSIDGTNNILGQAQPCWIRNSNFLTISGLMRFDTADVAGLISGGSLNAVIKHEMAHVLGFGTLWAPSLFNCMQNPSSTSSHPDTFYGPAAGAPAFGANCAHGQAAFDAIGGTTYTGGAKVPLENCAPPPASPASCGAGTFNSHWRETPFFNELMTGYLNAGANPASRLTIGAMEDLGYTVDYNASEPYTRTFTAPPLLAAASQRMIDLSNDVSSNPIYVVDQNRRITAVARPR
jgi:hypothetical protein